MFSACVLLAIALFSGTLVTFLFDRSAPFPARLSMGAIIGLVTAAMAGFLLACVIGLTAACLSLTVVILLAPAVLLVRPDFRSAVGGELRSAVAAASSTLRHPSAGRIGLILFYAAVTVLLGTLFSFAIYQNSEGIYTGVTNNLGDLTLHLQVINSFVHGQNFPPQDPTFAGVRFAYPFLCDVLTAMLVRAGADVIGAMWLQGTLLSLVLVGLMHYWTLLLTRSHLAGIIAVALLLFSGGLGWGWMLLDLHNSDHGLIPLLGNLQHDYTINLDGLFRWGNSMTALFIPQRSILFGVPLALVIFCQWWTVLTGTKNTAAPQSWRARMLASGMIAGLLPLSHAHSFLVLMGAGACLALAFRHTLAQWIWFFAPAAILALPQVLWLAGSKTIHAGAYIAWHPGWDHGNLNVVQFWLLNAGFFIPALLIALLWRDSDVETPRPLLRYYLPFLLCFIVPNLISLAPWVWDNIKVLIYWYIGSAPLVALLLARGFERGSHWRWVAAGALASMIMAGALDIARVVTDASPNREFSGDDIAAAQMMLERTQPHDVVVQAPTWNSAVFLTGRVSVLGYPGWIGSRGLPYRQRESDIRQIYEGAPQAEALLKQYHIQYVVIGPAELGSLNVNEQFWAQQKKVAQAGGYRLYQTPYPATAQVERARK
jgi:hypothetical protein